MEGIEGRQERLRSDANSRGRQMQSCAASVVTALFLSAAAVTGASGQSQSTPKSQNTKSISPGGVRITARNPLQGNWIWQGSVCTCKPLACAAASKVSY